MHQGENISSEERDERAKLGRSLASHQAKEDNSRRRLLLFVSKVCDDYCAAAALLSLGQDAWLTAEGAKRKSNN
jgi:hypothetical protein